MEDDERKGWRQFHKLTFDSRKLSRKVKRAEGVTIRHAHRFIITRLDNIRSVRRHIIGWLLLVGVMILAVSAQFMWFRQSYQTVAAAPGGTFAEASLGPVDTLNPLFASSSAEIVASRLLFSSLYTYDSTGHLKGDLAESIHAENNGTSYTVKIRPDARWHDGTQLTAKDIEFTVGLMKNPETRSPLRVNWRDVVVGAVDDTTIIFKLPAVYAAFPNALTFSVLPQHLLKDVAPAAIRENTFSRAPTGSGPFAYRLLQTAPGQSQHKAIYMAANERYYAGKPLLNRFEVHAYEGQDDILNALRSGEVSAASDITGTDPSQIDSRNYSLAVQSINSGVYSLFNTASPLLSDKTVRRALQLATDTAAIREGLAVDVPALNLPFIEGQITGADVARPPATDVAQAEALLEGAGWIMKDGVRQKGEQKLALSVVTTKNMQYEKALETLAGQWRRLGVAVNTTVVNSSDPSINFVQDILQRRNYDVLLYELFIGADPDIYAYWHSSQTVASGYNFSSYANKTADDALASARSRLEPELRSAKYKAFINQWVDDVPAIGLYQAVAEYAYNKHIHSVDGSYKLISAYDRFTNVLDWSVNQKQVYKTP